MKFLKEEVDVLMPRQTVLARQSSGSLYRKYYFPPTCLAVLVLFSYGIYVQSGDFVAELQLASMREADFACHNSSSNSNSGSNSNSNSGLYSNSNLTFSSPPIPPQTKVILFWTKFFQNENPYLRDELAACGQKKCLLTDDRSFLSRSSAVVFHIRDLSAADLPPCRNPKQFFVFFLLESPHHTGPLQLDQPPWPGFFNLTWTYRLDSDVFCPFYLDKFQPNIWTDRNFSRHFLRKKYDKALIFSSNCDTPSRRETYIRQLQLHFPVDIIGTCGQITCPKSDKECENLSHLYKFYLSFENSNCKDYMTEKVIRPFNAGTIPVVLGGGNYSRVFPAHSYIDTAAFESAEKLADYLWTLVRDFHLYEQYYDWKFQASQATLPSFASPAQVSICKLCDILHNDTFLSKRYDDIHAWWSKEAACKSGP